MSSTTWRRSLVLGGIRSGKSEYAEYLLAEEPKVRYVATARRSSADPGWAARIDAHRSRRPGGWTTVEVGADPFGLLDLLVAAEPNDALLVDDLGTWVAGVTEVLALEAAARHGFGNVVERVLSAVRACPARLVLVSPEVGLSVVPATESGRLFADALGSINRAVASACDRVVLVIAGNAVPVKGGL